MHFGLLQTPFFMQSKPLSYCPSVWYFRKALRESYTRDRALVIGLALCSELEQLKSWIRAQGLIPPKHCVMPAEARAKGWAFITNPTPDFLNGRPCAEAEVVTLPGCRRRRRRQ